MDLVERAGELKPMLVEFALSPRFDHHLSALIAWEFPDGMVTDEDRFFMLVDHFALQHRLPSGDTVVEQFVAAHPELTEAEREMLLGWRDVIEGIFEVTAKDGDAIVLLNHIDELTYRTRSNLGRKAFTSLKKRMFITGRLVRAGDDWMVSGNLATFPASERDYLLATAAEHAMNHPEAVFRNPAKLTQARRLLDEQHEAFVELFGDDLVVVPFDEIQATVDRFHAHLAQRVRPDADPPRLPAVQLGEDFLDSDNVAVHFVPGEGLSFYPDHDLLEEVFANPALIARRRYREALSDCLRDPDTSPEPLRRLAARDPDKASTLFTKLLKPKKGFAWDADGEAVLRKYKPSFFDGSRLPRTVPLSDPLSSAFRQARSL